MKKRQNKEKAEIEHTELILSDNKNNNTAVYEIVGENCGRDADGVFHCVCGKCKMIKG